MLGSDLALRDLLAASDVLFSATLTRDGTVLAANTALLRFAGVDPVGGTLAELVSAPQRERLAALLAAAESGCWTRATLTFTDGSPRPGEDRHVMLAAQGEELLLVAEPATLAGEQLVAQVLELNEDLIETQRELSRRQHAMERAEAEARTAAEHVRRLEAIMLAGLTRPDLDAVLAALLEIALEVLEADTAAVRLRPDGERRLRLAAATDPAAPRDDVPLGGPGVGGVAATGVALLTHDLAAVPLVLEREVIGVLEVTGGAIGARDVELLERVAERAALAIGHAQLRMRERAVVEALQRSVLPDSLPELDGLELCARYLPRTAGVEVGGDFYDVTVRADGRVSLTIGDVAGKGLAAASTVGRLRSALHAFVRESADPADVLARLDRVVLEDEQTMVTALHLVYDPSSRTLVYARAGHPPAVRVSAGGVADWLDGALAPPLGIGWDARVCATTTLAAGDRMLLYTDGLVERRGEALDEGLARLAEAAASGPGVPRLCEELVDEFTGDGFEDDVAVLSVGVS